MAAEMGNLSVMEENCSSLQTGIAPTMEFYLEVGPYISKHCDFSHQMFNSV